MSNYINILRPANLLIIALSQTLIYFMFIVPQFEIHGIPRLLDNQLILLFIGVTVLIAAGSYIINDIKDSSADLINKPTKCYVGGANLSVKSTYAYYILIILAGAFLAAYIAIAIEKPLLFCIYPLAVFLLFMYSHSWKKRSLSGNIIVAIFCAFVPAIIWYAESDGMAALQLANPHIVLVFSMYICFGFLITLVREIIKDIEDIEGDKAADYQTFPISAGVERAKMLAIFACIILISTYGLWMLALVKLQTWISLAGLVSLLLLPSIYILTKINAAKTKIDFSRLSKHCKYLLLASLIIFIVILLEI